MPSQGPPSFSAPTQPFAMRNNNRSVSDPQAESSNKQKPVLKPAIHRENGRSASPELGCVKHLTCYYWKTHGRCTKSDQHCAYSHRDTGHYADKPQIVNRGEKAKAGKNLRKAEKNKQANPIPIPGRSSREVSGESMPSTSQETTSPPRLFSVNVAPSPERRITNPSSVANGNESQDRAQVKTRGKLEELDAQLRVALWKIDMLQAGQDALQAAKDILQTENSDLKAALRSPDARNSWHKGSEFLGYPPISNSFGVIGGPVLKGPSPPTPTRPNVFSTQVYNDDGVALLPKRLLDSPRNALDELYQEWDLAIMAHKTR
ncbi:hypothetical protein LTR84_002875 [Exophiala bonariae]|uniref:C3H1-type domain-containing protein n=1 Tax=Exophiala bonariae TaxID=1690606 RepID=A0AAV9N8U5_9EURO|nr:hypothetical protein LTR84_002875 [Exophiala bonariae]